MGKQPFILSFEDSKLLDGKSSLQRTISSSFFISSESRFQSNAPTLSVIRSGLKVLGIESARRCHYLGIDLLS